MEWPSVGYPKETSNGGAPAQYDAERTEMTTSSSWIHFWCKRESAGLLDHEQRTCVVSAGTPPCCTADFSQWSVASPALVYEIDPSVDLVRQGHHISPASNHTTCSLICATGCPNASLVQTSHPCPSFTGFGEASSKSKRTARNVALTYSPPPVTPATNRHDSSRCECSRWPPWSVPHP